MIRLTDRDTCKTIEIDENQIVTITESVEEIGNRAYPFSELKVRDTRYKIVKRHKYFDVVESKNRINLLAEQANGGKLPKNLEEKKK